MHPNTASILRYFEYSHLPAGLADVSEKFHALAHYMIDYVGLEGPETTVMLRKLLEAKDCAVRAALDITTNQGGSLK